MSKSARFLSSGIIGLTVVILAVAVWGISFIRFNSDFERFFPPDEPNYMFYQNYLGKFEPFDDRILIAVTAQGGILEGPNLEMLEKLAIELGKTNNILTVRSVLSERYFMETPMGIFPAPYIHPSSDGRRRQDSIRISKTAYILRNFVSEDFRHYSLALEYKHDMSLTAIAQLRTDLHGTLANSGFQEYHIVGRSLSMHEITNQIRDEMLLFMAIAFVATCLLLWGLYRNVADMVLPLFIVMAATLLLLGFMGWTGQEIDLLSAVLPAVLFVIGLADMIHIHSHFQDGLVSGKSRQNAIWSALKEVGLATLITSVTTAIGFLTLLTSQIPSVRQFGLFAALGIAIAYVLAITLYPAILALLPLNKPALAHRPLQPVFDRMFLVAIRWKKSILIAGVIIILYGLAMLPLLSVDNYLAEDLPKDHQITRGYDFFDEHFGGIRMFEMAIFPKNKLSPLDYEVVRQTGLLQDYIEAHWQGTTLVGLPLMVKMANQVANTGNPDHYKLPENSQTYSKLMPRFEKISRTKYFHSAVSKDGESLRIICRIPDIGGKTMQARMKDLTGYANENCDILEIRFTGVPYLLDQYNQQMVKDMMLAMAIALVLVGLLMALLYQDARVLIAAFIVNLIPLLMMVIVLTAFGIYLNIPKAIIFTIALGISVDDSIHFLSRARLEMRKGKPVLYSVKRSLTATGRAIMFTSLILLAGFGGMLFSQFGSTFYFGLLISVSIVTAVATDLLLLPLLIVWMVKD